jgi:hypothetical protein
MKLPLRPTERTLKEVWNSRKPWLSFFTYFPPESRRDVKLSFKRSVRFATNDPAQRFELFLSDPGPKKRASDHPMPPFNGGGVDTRISPSVDFQLKGARRPSSRSLILPSDEGQLFYRMRKTNIWPEATAVHFDSTCQMCRTIKLLFVPAGGRDGQLCQQ